MSAKVIADGDTWTILETETGIDVLDPDWSKVKVSRKQADILNCRAKNVIVNAGTGFGKDWVMLEWGKELAKTLFEARQASGFRRGGPCVTVAICAPTESNYLETWDKLKDQIPHVPGNAPDGSANYEVREGKRKFIQLFGKRGIRFEMITLFKADSVRGRGWDICLITEAAYMKYIDFRKVVLKRVNRGGYYGAIMLISTPKNNWFDDACEDARDKKGGEFSMYQYFHATSYDNPLLTPDVLEAIKAQESGNPAEHDQERLAKLHVEVYEGKPDCPFDPSMVSCCLTKDPIKLAGNANTLLVFDLMYGGDDLLCMGVWNELTLALARLQFWTAAELKMDRTNPMGSLVPLIEREAGKFPGCKVAFDRQGREGGALPMLLPARLRIVPMTRSREQKNDHVENFHTRIATVDEHGVSQGIKLPHPESTHLDETQRRYVKLLLNQIHNYQKIYEKDRDGNTKRKPDGSPVYYFTKGPGCGDDGMDMVTWSCSQLPSMRRAGSLNQSAMRARVLG